LPITERTLKKWRKDAPRQLDFGPEFYEGKGTCANLARAFMEDQRRILRMTQELLDQHLLRKK